MDEPLLMPLASTIAIGAPPGKVDPVEENNENCEISPALIVPLKERPI